MRLLDLFCGAGGATKGYQRAGFHVVGIDVKPQPHYVGDDFIQADAISFMRSYLATSIGSNGHMFLDSFDAFHASPPCQAYSEATPIKHRPNHPDLIAEVRELLAATHKPSVIENISGAKHLLRQPVMLCGTMFGLPLWRHRFFEIAPTLPLMAPFTCNHDRRPVVTHAGSNSRRLGPVLVTGSTRRKAGRFEFSVADCRAAMDIPWMTRTEIDEAIPPAYTEWIGKQLMRALTPSSDFSP